jgi:hypothetical protein
MTFLRLERRSFLKHLVLGMTALSFIGCVPRTPGPAGTPVADPETAAAEVQRASVPATPQQVTFGWTLNEAGSRLTGRGVARLVAPERLRLDLFGPRGETYLSAALIDDEFRVPEGLAGALTLPSPSLLWGAVGVVRPPAGAQLASVTATERELIVRYVAPDGDTFEYRAADEALRLTSVSRASRTGVSETLQLTRDATGGLESTRYRDLAAYRELVLTIEATQEVASFPPNIWSPDGPAR